MNLKTRGIILKQKNFLNEQKFITILTFDRGIVHARLKIGGQINRNMFSNVNVLGYYDFDIFEGRFGCVVDSVELLESFFNLRYSPKKLALAQYFCELTTIFIPSKQQSKKHLSLLLNSLWLLCDGKLKCEFIKAVFELRLISISGYMPNLVGCKFCCCYEKPKMFYVLHQGFLVCDSCLKVNDVKGFFEIEKPVLHAMRFIIYKDDKDIFGFRLNSVYLTKLSCLIERCVLIFSECELKTLRIYHQFSEEF